MTNSRARVKLQLVIKKADESVDTSTTLQNDDELLLPVLASKTYYFDLILFFDGHSDGDIKYKWAVPTGTTITWHTVPVVGGVAMVTTGETQLVTQACTAAGTTTMIVHHGLITTSTTIGNIQLTWAQNASHATATKILKGSSFRIYLT